MPRILAVGDLMVGDSAASPGFGFGSRYGAGGLLPAFAPVSDLLRSGDLVLGNLEVMLSRSGAGDRRHAARDMRGWPRFAADLRAVGFTALNLANNHALQHGPEVFEETRALLEAAGIVCVGLRGELPWTCAPVTTALPDGTRVGLLGYCMRPRQYHRTLDPPFAEGDPEKIRVDVSRLAPACDLLIVSLHWGEDYVDRPSEEEVALAHGLLETGATLIIGHHPHVLRPVERTRKGLIAYSLGNFIGDQTWHPALARAAVLECRTDGARLGECRTHPTILGPEYTVQGAGPPIVVSDAPSSLSHSPESYRVEAEARATEFRHAKHRHAIRNLWRSDLRQMGQLAIRTLSNRLKALRGRLS